MKLCLLVATSDYDSRHVTGCIHYAVYEAQNLDTGLIEYQIWQTDESCRNGVLIATGGHKSDICSMVLKLGAFVCWTDPKRDVD